MPRNLKTIRVFACVLLICLVCGASFKTRSSAAKPGWAQSDGNDVRVTISTYDDGKLVRSVTVPAGSSTAIRSFGVSVPGAAPLQPATAGDIVLSQIYSHGGNVGSTYQNNYLELFNRTDNTIDFSGWQIYLANDTGSFNVSFSFGSSQGLPIAAHKYLLIKLGPDSSNGAPVPWDLFVPPITVFPAPNLSPSGKVFLTRPNSTIFGGTCPLPNSQIVDFVGYGSTASCFEGTGPAPTTANSTAAIRKFAGCTDTENNASDFVADAASPHNRFSAANNCSNPIDNPEFFVRQHYADFLSRVPDADGLAYWTNEITSCGADSACIEIKRINVSAAFFLSIEFQETGYLVERMYKTAYGDADGLSQLNTPGTPHPIKVPVIRLSEFLTDSQSIAHNVIVGQPGWPQQLESNKVAFTQDFVTRSRFTTKYPTARTPAQLVGELYSNAGVTPDANEFASVVAEFGGAIDTSDNTARARALRRVAENPTLTQQETNRAFVLMQYFGYLRRNPNDAPDTDHTGYDFWLTKLNQFNGNFVNAEMVKAFLVSIEYRQRF